MELPGFEARKTAQCWEVRFTLPQNGYREREARAVAEALNLAMREYEAKHGNEVANG